MTREEALKLQVGIDKIFIADPTLEEVYEAHVVGVRLNTPSNFNSALEITGWCKTMSGRVYHPGEVHGTEAEALQKLGSIHQYRADQELNKKHAVCEKIAKLKAKLKGRRNG